MNEAIWAIIGVIIGALMSTGASWLMQSRQLKHEMRMYSLANQGKEVVKSVMLEILDHKAYTDRSFSALSERVRGFTDDELGQILHELFKRDQIQLAIFTTFTHLAHDFRHLLRRYAFRRRPCLGR
jgi:hypothetical protein